MNDELEIANALGFSSVAQMNEHQEWLAEEARRERLISGRVAQARASRSRVIDIRGIYD